MLELRVKYVGLQALQDGFAPLEIITNVETSYHQYKKCRKFMDTDESLDKLEIWQDNIITAVHEWPIPRLRFRVLPKHGRRLLIP
jgi:hypothetical protein